MLFGSEDNQIILYLQGNEDIAKLQQVLLQNKIRGVPAKKLADMLENEVNRFPTLNPDGHRDAPMLEDSVRRYGNLIVDFDAKQKKYKR